MKSPAWRRWLAGAAALAGALAPLAGSPYRRVAPAASGALAAPGRVDVAALARLVADQEDHVSAVELAAWLRARRPGLRVIDVRSAAEFRAYHIPGAEHVAFDYVVNTRFATDETLVLYSETGIHAAQAWVFLRALGYHHVLFLRNGLLEWLADVMSPVLAADASAEARARFAHIAELSRWFGGTPRQLTTAGAAASPAPPASWRRGC